MVMLANSLSPANAGNVWTTPHTMNQGVIVSFAPPSGVLAPFPIDVTGRLINGVTLPGGQLFCSHGGVCYVQVVPLGDEDDQPHPPGTHLAAVTGAPPGSDFLGKAASLAQIEAHGAVAVLCCTVLDAPPQFTADGAMLQLVQWLPAVGASVAYAPPP